MEKVREEDVLSVAVRMVLGLCCACLGCVNEEGTRRSERRPCPKVAFEPNRDGRWTTSSSAQARQTVGWSKVGSIRASFDPRDKGQWSTRKAGERTKKGEARVLLSQRLASALSEVESRDAREELLPKADTSLLQPYLSFKRKEPSSLQKSAQLVQILRSVRDALSENRVRRIRSLYYDNPSLFNRSFKVTKTLVEKLCAYWNVHSSKFNVLAASRGMYAGPALVETIECYESTKSLDKPNSTQGSCVGGHVVRFISEDGQDRTYTPMTIPDVSTIRNIKLLCEIPWVLIVEKETIFHERVQELNALVHPGNSCGLIVTGRGVPDHTTRRFLQYLKIALPLGTQFYTMMDGDAYGMHIAHLYATVSGNQGDLEQHKPLLDVDPVWIGLHPSQWRLFLTVSTHAAIEEEEDDMMLDARYDGSSTQPRSQSHIDGSQCVPLDASEYQKCLSVIRRKDISLSIRREVCKLLKLGFKLELEAIRRRPLRELLP